MNIKDMKSVDILLKLISNDFELDFSYKLVCKWKNQLVTLDLTVPFEWKDEFYCSEPKTISSTSDDSKTLYIEANSLYYALRDRFKFRQLIDCYKNRDTHYLTLYLLENENFYNFDLSYSDFAYNVESLDKTWSIPIVKIDDDLEFISFQLVKHEQN